MNSTKDKIIRDNQFTTVKVRVHIYKQGRSFVAYCPALELSAYGSTSEDAQLAFQDNLRIFFSETRRKGTLEKILLKLGWSLTQSPQPRYQPPKEIPPFLLNMKNARQTITQIPIPI